MPAKTLFVAPNDDAQSLGEPLISTLNALGDSVKPIMKKHGLTDIQPDGYYPMQSYLNVLKEVLESDANASSQLVAIGRTAMLEATMPPEIDTLEKALGTLEPVYRIHHKVNQPGWDVVPQNDGSIHLIDYTPMPPDLSYGVAYGLVERYANGQRFSVRYKDLKERNNPDAESVTFILKIG